MWKVFVWVPTKGWKLVRKFMAKDRAKAIYHALDFVPLEVKLVSPSKNVYVSGRMHAPSIGDAGLSQIEAMIENPDQR